MPLATTVTILLLHGGGFVGGDPSSVVPLANDLRAAGYDAIAVDYRTENPTGNVLGEIATVRRQVQAVQGRGPVVLYGVSSGGTLAAALAARGEVAGAVVAGGPTNLLTWIGLSPLPTPQFWRRLGMDNNARREASPYYRLNGHQSPQLLLYGDIDLVVPIDQGLNYLRAAQKGQPDTTFNLMSVSPHAFWPSYQGLARRWIQARWPASPRSLATSSPLAGPAHLDETLVQTRVMPKLRVKRNRQQSILLRRYRVPVH
ncbi:MAG TPA: alpha/beta fold hydrolase [Solirubrobacteraceae bacterium]|jgi:acetyl esterase/lipase|nr:alpha/beta fold hydrolase [Solirubrobacteraceae bacterium]